MSTVEEAGPSDGARLCGFSRCRRPLPDDGAGRKRDYCRERTWPAGDREVGCREAGRAERLLGALHGEAVTSGVDAVHLGERIDAAVGALRAAVAPATALQDALAGVRTQLDEAVGTALAERDRARECVAKAEGRADAAQQHATDAEATADSATAERDTARRAAGQAEQARQHAERERLAAEGRLAEVQHQLGLATERCDALTRRCEELTGALAHTEAERDAARTGLAAERDRTSAADARAGATAAAAAGERDRHRTELAELRSIHGTDLAALREQHATGLAEQRARHDTAIAAAHERAGGLAQRADTAEATAARHATDLRALRDGIAAALAAPAPDEPGPDTTSTEPGTATPTGSAELRARLRVLLDAPPGPPAE